MSKSSVRWGWVWAEPHECLVVLRHGEVVQVRRGGAVFKWPGDAVARVDTSLRRLQFSADQVTREKTGVEVTGLAVYRIVRPELAMQMLDLRDPEALTRVLTEMCVGATRRLVANLSLDDCLTRRKDALADELMAEVAPVLAGRGQIDDDSDQGWGVAIDTIEVQDVRVLSAEVFDRLQAPYREKLALEALAAAEEVRVEEARLERQAEAAREAHRHAMHAQEEARIAAERAREDAQALHRGALARKTQEAAAERERMQAENEVEVARLQADAQRTRGAIEVTLLRERREALGTVSEARLRELMLTETMPRVAEAFAGSFDHAVVTGGDLGFLSAAVGQVVSTLDAFGVDLKRPT